MSNEATHSDDCYKIHHDCAIALVERLRAENSHLHHQTNKLGGDILRLRAEVAALKKDAERYRWLRGDATEASERWMRWNLQRWDGRSWHSLERAALDDAIDAALSSTEKT